jgi:uncharacterized membrane protein
VRPVSDQANIPCWRSFEARAFTTNHMFYAALFCALFIVVGAFYFLSNRKQNRAPGLREAMAIIAGLIAIVIFWVYRSRG